jgi:energy-coupling factor transporter transmembrane protein EcfT
MRMLFALVLAFHGFIHLIGFVVPWRLAEIRGFGYSTRIAWGRFDVGDVGARAIGIGWLLGCLAFLVAAAGVWTGASWSLSMVAVAAAFSLVLCLAGSPEALAGLIIDLLIFGVLIVVHVAQPRLLGGP